MTDWTRNFDLEELTDAIKNARSTTEREYYERIMHKILNESEKIRYWREELMKAIRVNDERRIKLVHHMINKTRLDETAGHSWGNIKGERGVN